MTVPLLLHCNGDASIDGFLTAYEFARDSDYSRPWNVTTIHTQFMRKDHIPKFVRYKIRPSFYTLHTFYFADAHIANRGKEQAMYISPMCDAIDAGLTVQARIVQCNPKEKSPKIHRNIDNRGNGLEGLSL